MKRHFETVLTLGTAFYLVSSPLMAMDKESPEKEGGKATVSLKPQIVMTPLEDGTSIGTGVVKAKEGKVAKEADITLITDKSIKVSRFGPDEQLVRYDLDGFRDCPEVFFNYCMSATEEPRVFFVCGMGKKLPLLNYENALNKVLPSCVLSHKNLPRFKLRARKKLKFIGGDGEKVRGLLGAEPEVFMDATETYQSIHKTLEVLSVSSDPRVDRVQSRALVVGSMGSWMASWGWMGAPVKAQTLYMGVQTQEVTSGADQTSKGVEPVLGKVRGLEALAEATPVRKMIQKVHNKRKAPPSREIVLTKRILKDGTIFEERVVKAREGLGTKRAWVKDFSQGAIKIGTSDVLEDYQVKYDLSEFRGADVVKLDFTIEYTGFPVEVFVLGDNNKLTFEDGLEDWSSLVLSRPVEKAKDSKGNVINFPWKGAIRIAPLGAKKLEFVVTKKDPEGILEYVFVQKDSHELPPPLLGEMIIHDMKVQAMYEPSKEIQTDTQFASMATDTSSGKVAVSALLTASIPKI